MRRFEYLIGMEQQSRMTWVNDAWAGTLRPDPGQEQAALESCPTTTAWLAERGQAGWQLVSVVQGAQPSVRTLYLIREL